MYNAGDTSLFLDMQLIGQSASIDLALLPIGDNFTMGIDDAVKAVELLKPKKVVPVHYNTFPPVMPEVDPQAFAKKVQALGVEAEVMEEMSPALSSSRRRMSSS